MENELFHLYKVAFTYGTSRKNVALIGAEENKGRITLLEFLERETLVGKSGDDLNFKVQNIEDTNVKINTKGVIFVDGFSKGKTYFKAEDGKLQDYKGIVHDKGKYFS